MRLHLIAGLGLLLACTASNPLFGDRDSGAQTSGGASTGGTDPSDPTAVSAPTSADPSDATGSSDGGSSGVADGSTGAPSCEIGGVGGVQVAVHRDGEAVSFCEPFDITGAVGSLDENRWQASNCPCGNQCSEFYEVEIQVPPVMLPQMPACARIQIIPRPGDGCEFGAIRIIDANAAGDPENPPPVWVASHGRLYADGPIHPGLLVAEELHAPCPCDGTDCCRLEPGAYALHFFTGDPADEEVSLLEGDELIGPNAIPLAPFGPGLLWEVAALSAHVPTACDAPPAFDWVVRRPLE